MIKHVIPVNISDDGRLFGGAVKKRNAIETIVIILAGALFFKVVLASLPLIPKVIAFVVVVLVPAGITFVGIGDQSAIEFIFTSLSYRKQRDIIPYELQIENMEEEPVTIEERFKNRREQRKKKKREKKEERARVKAFEKSEKKARKAEKHAERQKQKGKKRK